MKNLKRICLTVIAALILVDGFNSLIPKVFATTGGGTATIAVDGGAQGAGVTVVQSTSHIFTIVLTIPGAGMTLGAASPTFTIPTGFTAPTTHAVANAGLVVVDGQWSVLAGGGGCTVDSSPVSSTTVASGQIITVDITADCAVGNTITLIYKGTSAIAMGATTLTVSTADAGDPGPVTPLIAGSSTITVTAALTPTPTPTLTPTPTPTPIPGSTPTPTPTPGSGGSGSGGSSSTGIKVCPTLGYIAPIIIEERRISPTSVFISWGPYSGINTFIVQYGLENGKWLYSTNVTGFSTAINGLPANQPIWIRVSVTDNCSVGNYGESKFVGGPSLPSTGFAPHDRNIPWYIPVGIFLLSLFLLRLKRICSS